MSALAPLLGAKQNGCVFSAAVTDSGQVTCLR
jgi:hypothetical protein